MTQIQFNVESAKIDKAMVELIKQDINHTVDSTNGNYPKITADITKPDQVFFCKELSVNSIDILRPNTTQQFIDDTKQLKADIENMLTMYQLKYGVAVTDFTATQRHDLTLDTVYIGFKSTLKG